MRKRIRFWLISIINVFTVPVLFSTLFDPWKRDQVHVIGASLEGQLQALWLNILSRLIGFFVRLSALIAAGLALIATGLFGGVVYLTWLLWPLIAIGLILRGLSG